MKFQFFGFAELRLSFTPVSSGWLSYTHPLSKIWRGAFFCILFFCGEKSLLKSKIDPKHRFYMILPVLSKISLPSTQMDLWTRSCAESPIYCILNRSGGGPDAWNSSHGDLWSLKVGDMMIYTKPCKMHKTGGIRVPHIPLFWSFGPWPKMQCYLTGMQGGAITGLGSIDTTYPDCSGHHRLRFTMR